MKQDRYEYEINLLEYWRMLARKRKFIGIFTAVAFVLAVIASLLIPKTYLSKTSIMPPSESSPLMASLAAGGPAGLGGFAGSLLGVQTPSDLWLGILRSQSVRDAVIERFKLKELYGKETIEDTREALDGFVAIEKSKEEIISVSVEDTDPQRSAQMSNAFIEELDRINREVATSSGRRARVFLEIRLNEAKTELAGAENDLRDFMKKNRAVNIDEQSKALVEASGVLMGQLMAKKVGLQTLLSYSTPSNPQVQLLQSEVDELESQLNRLETGSSAGDNVMLIPAARIPDLSLMYVRLLRNVKFQQTLFELLTQQYEMARIQEMKDSPTVQVLDIAKVPEKKYKPKRSLIVLGATMSAFICAVLWVFAREYASRARHGF